MSDHHKIWFNDMTNFINSKNYFIIIPLSQMSIEDKINSIIRFLVYFGILLTLIRMNTKYLMIPIIAGLVSIIVYKYETRRKDIIETELEKRDLDIINNKVCTRVTIDNPFMNPSLVDLTYNPDKPDACDITNESVSKNVENKFNAHVFQDVNDIFNNKASQRQFYTLPSTSIPNNRQGLADWLYNRGPSCKEGNGDQCWRNKVTIGVQGRGHT